MLQVEGLEALRLSVEVVAFHFAAHFFVADVVETGKGGALDVFDLMVWDNEPAKNQVRLI